MQNCLRRNHLNYSHHLAVSVPASLSSVHAVELLAGKASSRNNFEPICNAFSLQGVFKGSLPFQPVPENGHFVFVAGIKINVQIVLKG